MQRYEIQVRGVLGPTFRAYFDGFEVVETPDGTGPPSTILTGDIADQSALHGLLARVRDLGLELEAVRRVSVD